MFARVVRRVANVAPVASRWVGSPLDTAQSYAVERYNQATGSNAQSGPPTVMGTIGTLGARAQAQAEAMRQIRATAIERSGQRSPDGAAFFVRAAVGVSHAEASAPFQPGGHLSPSAVTRYTTAGYVAPELQLSAFAPPASSQDD